MLRTYCPVILLLQSQKSFIGFVDFFGQFDDDQNRWQQFFFFFHPRVNLKTTFPVHKSSFCVRILLLPELTVLIYILWVFVWRQEEEVGAALALAPPLLSPINLIKRRVRRRAEKEERAWSSGGSRILTQKLDLWTGKVVFKLTLG